MFWQCSPNDSLYDVLKCSRPYGTQKKIICYDLDLRSPQDKKSKWAKEEKKFFS
ncbi:unnamed protein product, partial [marine sediment metagenome]